MDVSTPLVLLFLGSFILLGVLSLTAFVKLSIVFMILRNALGLQQVPSNMVVMTLTFFLSMFISLPVFTAAVSTIETAQLEAMTPLELIAAFNTAMEPIQTFLSENTSSEYTIFFQDLSNEMWGGGLATIDQDSIVIQIPAFMISELTEAFQIGFLIYLPFIAIDLAVTIILMAMGMQQVQPSIIATPFKLFLFVTLDGWSKLVSGLMFGYSVGGG